MKAIFKQQNIRSQKPKALEFETAIQDLRDHATEQNFAGAKASGVKAST